MTKEWNPNLEFSRGQEPGVDGDGGGASGAGGHGPRRGEDAHPAHRHYAMGRRPPPAREPAEPDRADARRAAGHREREVLRGNALPEGRRLPLSPELAGVVRRHPRRPRAGEHHDQQPDQFRAGPGQGLQHLGVVPARKAGIGDAVQFQHAGVHQPRFRQQHEPQEHARRRADHAEGRRADDPDVREGHGRRTQQSPVRLSHDPAHAVHGVAAAFQGLES